MILLFLLIIFCHSALQGSQLVTFSSYIKPAPNAQSPQAIKTKLTEIFKKEELTLGELGRQDNPDPKAKEAFDLQLAKVQMLIIQLKTPKRMIDLLNKGTWHINPVTTINTAIAEYEKDYGIAHPQKALQEFHTYSALLTPDDHQILQTLEELYAKRNVILAHAYLRSRDNQDEPRAPNPQPQPVPPVAPQAVVIQRKQPPLPFISLLFGPRVKPTHVRSKSQ